MTFDEGASFEAWWKANLWDYFHLSQQYAAKGAWRAATLAERERCTKVCDALYLKMSLRGDPSLVEGWERFREEVLSAIRNG